MLKQISESEWCPITMRELYSNRPNYGSRYYNHLSVVLPVLGYIGARKVGAEGLEIAAGGKGLPTLGRKQMEI